MAMQEEDNDLTLGNALGLGAAGLVGGGMLARKLGRGNPRSPFSGAQPDNFPRTEQSAVIGPLTGRGIPGAQALDGGIPGFNAEPTGGGMAGLAGLAGGIRRGIGNLGPAAMGKAGPGAAAQAAQTAVTPPRSSTITSIKHAMKGNDRKMALGAHRENFLESVKNAGLVSGTFDEKAVRSLHDAYAKGTDPADSLLKLNKRLGIVLGKGASAKEISEMQTAILGMLGE